MKKSRHIWRIAGIVSLALALCPAGNTQKTFAQEKGRTGEEMNFDLLESYKKEGENNPLYTQRFGADPGVMEYNGRFYVYMTNDIIEYGGGKKVKENTYSKIRSINCISSDDMVNWTDHGEIPVAGSWGIARWAVNSWAPCAAHKEIDGKEKFFLYFCNGGNGIGVLVSDSPTGPWEDVLGKPLISRSVPGCADVVWLFDPAVMVDDDGTGYLAFGGGVPEGKQENPGTGRIVRLGEDMVSLDMDPVPLDVPYLFEDSGINKINGKYIYSYCSNWQTGGNKLGITDGAIQYMVSDDPLGPYTYAGQMFPNQGNFFGLYGNNHHSIGCLDGELYLFYHNRPVEKAMGITGNYRSPQADRILTDETGKMSVRGTMKGIGQKKSFDPTAQIPASTMSDQAGIEVKAEDNVPVVHTKKGAWIRISGADFGEGGGTLLLRAGSGTGSSIYVVLDSPDRDAAAKAQIPEGSEEPAAFELPLSVNGVHDLYFIFDGEADFYTWQFVRAE